MSTDAIAHTVKPFYLDLDEAEIEEFARESAEILRSGRLILGEHTERFEASFAKLVGARHAISVNSGSFALETLLRMKQVEDKTVLVPTNTNFATVAAVLRAGGRVEYLDMDKATFAPTLAMVRDAVERGRSRNDTAVAGVMWVHIGGVLSPELPEVVEYCHDRDLFLLEDAAHAHGSQLNGVQAGNLADGGAFSFFPTKVMTTCEGGMITTNDDEQDYLARSHRNQGKRGMDFGGLHHDFGNSSRMTEINALLGRIQLRKLPQMLVRRATAYSVIAGMLDEAGIDYVSTRHMDLASNYKLIVCLSEGRKIDEVKKATAGDGVILGGTVYELPCHRQPVFEGIDSERALPGADRWCPNHICPPLTSGMSEDDARQVGASLVRHLG
jgi:dTDP-4-amino-4,6-dideoxygalactose transaminase